MSDEEFVDEWAKYHGFTLSYVARERLLERMGPRRNPPNWVSTYRYNSWLAERKKKKNKPDA